jgi:hypothetical protein
LYSLKEGPLSDELAPLEAVTATLQPDITASLQRLIERQSGDAGRVAELLYRENYDLRERARQLSEQIPAQGAVVLPPDQAAHWQAYQQLGEPDALTQRLTAAEQAAQELAGLRRAEQLRTVADAAGYRPSVLGRLAEGLALELRDGTPVVVTGDTVTPLADYAQREWAEFLPALAVTPAGTSYVKQATTVGQGSDPVAAFTQQRNEERDKAPNPLRRS